MKTEKRSKKYFTFNLKHRLKSRKRDYWFIDIIEKYSNKNSYSQDFYAFYKYKSSYKKYHSKCCNRKIRRNNKIGLHITEKYSNDIDFPFLVPNKSSAKIKSGWW
jgi:hypothetical protein